jgi:raffinose/stachyose/melibiose transport system permease protein
MNMNKKLYILRLLFIAPTLFFFAIFVVYPFIGSIYFSLTEWDGLNKSIFIGFANFERLFADRDFIGAIWNTVFYSVFSLLACNIGSLLLALCLNMKLRGTGYLRTIFYLPAVLSLTVVSVIWSIILNYDGSFNFFLSQLGFATDNRVDWIANYNIAKWTLSFIMLWGGMGYSAVFYLAGLGSIPNEIYESSTIDGAGGFIKLRFITLPLLMPSITIVTFLNLVGSLKVFDLPYIMTNGGGGATTSMAMQVYVLAFRNGTYGYATAAGVVLFIFVSIISFTQVIFTRKREVQY